MTFLSPVSLGDGNVRYDINSLDSQYFLLVICAKEDVHITDVKVSTPCDEYPSGSEIIGEYDSYTQDELMELPIDFPFIGNGSYETNISEGYRVDFYLSGLKGNIDNFRYSLVKYGYVLVDISIDTYHTYTYQKENIESTSEYDTHFTLTITEGVIFDDFVFSENITYYNDPTWYIGPEINNTWPSEDIAITVGDIGYKYVAIEPQLNVPNIEYQFSDNGYAYVSWSSLDEYYLQNIVDGVKNYKKYFEELGFITNVDRIFPRSTGEPYCVINYKLYSPDLRYFVGMNYQCDGMGKKCDLTFEFDNRTVKNVTEFNDILIEHNRPGIIDTGMNFIFNSDNNCYYSSPIKVSNLYNYASILTGSGVTITELNKNTLNSDIISFTRYKHSLIYKITISNN